MILLNAKKMENLFLRIDYIIWNFSINGRVESHWMKMNLKTWPDLRRIARRRESMDVNLYAYLRLRKEVKKLMLIA